MAMIETINSALAPSSGSSSRGSTAVLVTNQFQCERLIKAGRAVANITKTDLTVLNVQGSEYPPNPQAIQYLFNISSQNDAVMNLLYSEDSYKAIVRYIKGYHAVNVITGMPSTENSVLHQIWKKFNHVKFFTVGADGTLDEVFDKSIYAHSNLD